jgi:putative colanic acid biosynthesis UDP-glucose lipid carrier transferase
MSLPVHLSSPGLRYVAWALDALIIAAVGWATYVEYHFGMAVGASLPVLYQVVLVCAALLLGTFSDGLYRSWRINDLLVMLRSVATVWGSVVLLIMLGLFLNKSTEQISRVWFVSWAVLSWVTLSLQRLGVYLFLRWLRKQGYNYKTVVLVGFTPASQQVLQAIRESAWSGLRVQAHIQPFTQSSPTNNNPTKFGCACH